MAKVDLWSTVRAERTALADDLEKVDEEQWNTRSLCAEWTVRDTLAHMTATAKMGPPQFFGKFLGAGFSVTRMQNRDIAAERGDSGADALARFRAEIGSTKHPPGPADAFMAEVIIHGEDIRRSLGLTHEYPTDAVTQCAQFYKGSNLIVGAKSRIKKLTLRATDSDWSTGSGPEVTGPVLALLMAMTGRKPALDDLSGEGVATLRGRP